MVEGHHQDYSIFSRESQPKPSLATGILGGGTTQRIYTIHFHLARLKLALAGGEQVVKAALQIHPEAPTVRQVGQAGSMEGRGGKRRGRYGAYDRRAKTHERFYMIEVHRHMPDMRERYLSRNVNIGERFAEDPRKTR